MSRPCSNAVGPRAGLCAPTDANTIAIAYGDCYSYGNRYSYSDGYCNSDSNTYTDSIGCLPTIARLLEKSFQCLASE